MKGYTLLVSMLALIFSAQAQDYQPGKLVLNNQEELTGLVRNDFLPGDDKVFFRNDESSEIRELTTASLQQIEFTVKNSIKISFRKERIFESYGKAGEPIWLQMIVEGPVTLYARTGRDYIMYCNGHFMGLDQKVSFFLKRPEDEAARLTGSFDKSAFNVNADHNFIKLTSEFLADNSTLYDRLRDREFSILEIPMVVQMYNTSAIRDETLP